MILPLQLSSPYSTDDSIKIKSPFLLGDFCFSLAPLAASPANPPGWGSGPVALCIVNCYRFRRCGNGKDLLVVDFVWRKPPVFVGLHGVLWKKWPYFDQYTFILMCIWIWYLHLYRNTVLQQITQCSVLGRQHITHMFFSSIDQMIYIMYTGLLDMEIDLSFLKISIAKISIAHTTLWRSLERLVFFSISVICYLTGGHSKGFVLKDGGTTSVCEFVTKNDKPTLPEGI